MSQLALLCIDVPIGFSVAILFDYAINRTSGRREWIWQTWARLRREHKRLYPKEDES